MCSIALPLHDGSTVGGLGGSLVMSWPVLLYDYRLQNESVIVRLGIPTWSGGWDFAVMIRALVVFVAHDIAHNHFGLQAPRLPSNLALCRVVVTHDPA